MAQQTALQWFRQELLKRDFDVTIQEIYEQAKQMEADQSKADCDIARMQGWNAGYEDGRMDGYGEGYDEGLYDGMNK